MNKNLRDAKRAKNDEFYTRLEDIQIELEHYTDHFKHKVVYLNCDDPTMSNFWKYFVDEFDNLQLKKVIATYYKENETVYKWEYDGNTIITTPLEQNGDFRSPECVELLKEVDIVVTNPPFSLFREYVAQLIEYDKKFIIIGSKNAITYKDVFSLIKNNNLWLGPGFRGGNAFFSIPDGNNHYVDGVYNEETNLVKFRNCGWFTNVDHALRHEPLQLMSMEDNLKYNKKLHKKLEKDYGKIEYPKYDNYDAIEVPFTECIPSDYVPCWFECPLAEQCAWAGAEGMKDAEALCDKQVAKKKSVMESWGFQLPFLINSAQNNLKFLDFGIQDMQEKNSEQETVSPYQKIKKSYGTDQPFKEELSISELQYVKRCNGIMGVPITFLDKYCPEQFEIVGMSNYDDTPCHIVKNYIELGYIFLKSNGVDESKSGALKDKMSPKVYGKGNSDYSVSPEGIYLHAIYQRILIRRKQNV